MTQKLCCVEENHSISDYKVDVQCQPSNSIDSIADVIIFKHAHVVDNSASHIVYRYKLQEGQHPLTGQRVANFRLSFL